MLFWLNPAQAAQIESWGDVLVQVLPNDEPGVNMFPHDPEHYGTWTNDNYGPIWIPKAGVTIPISRENIAMYRRVIQVYENNAFEMRDGSIYINGTRATSYTFKQDYYWAMGDNRHNSEDSRIWGFVPEDHIVGKPLFIWMSARNGIRWNRLFTSAQKMD